MNLRPRETPRSVPLLCPYSVAPHKAISMTPLPLTRKSPPGLGLNRRYIVIRDRRQDQNIFIFHSSTAIYQYSVLTVSHY